MKDIKKVINSLKNRGSLFRGTTVTIIISQERGLLNILVH